MQIETTFVLTFYVNVISQIFHYYLVGLLELILFLTCLNHYIN